MLEVLHAEINPTSTRLGIVVIRYYELVVYCEICVYKEQNLWVRMPEIWTTTEFKRRLVYWENQKLSDLYQVIILKKVFDLIGLNLEEGIRIKREFLIKRKELTREKNKLTLNKKNTEV